MCHRGRSSGPGPPSRFASTFVRVHVPYRAVLVTYGLDSPSPGDTGAGKAADWESGRRSRLSTTDFPLVDTVPERRAECASRRGRPL